jgi:hypothetical protein
MEDELLFEAVGKTGQITVFENRIEICRKGFGNFILHGFDGTKILFVSKLTGIQFKETGKMTAGYIQFIVPGAIESQKGLVDATKDENTVLFDKNQEENFIKLKDFIISKIK